MFPQDFKKPLYGISGAADICQTSNDHRSSLPVNRK